MYRIVYVSAATRLLDQSALLSLMDQARGKNQRLGITGMLLYRDGNFIQLLEGEEAAVKAVYRSITADPRHTGIILLLEEGTDCRLFADWSMGFGDLSDPEVQAKPGFSPFMNTPLVAESFAGHPHDSLLLLSVFRNTF